MKKFIAYTAALALGCLMLASCSNHNEEVKEFAVDFGNKVAANQLDSVRMLYPGAEMADSMALAFSADSITVDALDKDGEYKVVYGNGKSITVTRAEDGKITVKESTGLFAYPKANMEFAAATGALTPDMTDAKLAEVMANIAGLKAKLYEDYVNQLKNALVVGKLKITKDITFMMEEGRGYYPLVNTTDQPIKAGDYTLNFRTSWIYFGDEGSKNYSEKGKKDIPAKGTIQVPITFTGHASQELISGTVAAPTMETFLANFKPTGKEYAEYAKTAKPLTPGKKLSDGPYTITGKIGGKYTIHMTLDKGMKTGSYYYDNKGAANKLTLSIKSFDPNSGRIVIEERTNKGDISGTFTGILTDSNFSGEMTVASNGKTYNFDMTAAH